MAALLAHPGSGNCQIPNQVAPAEVDDVFVLPTTAGQQGFWYLDQLQPGNPAYNIAVRFRLQGPLRVDCLERALNKIVARHESLRTTFGVREGMPVQVIVPQLTIPLPVDDLRAFPEPERARRAEVLAGDEARLRFDLARGPLIRTRLLRLKDEEHMLLMTVHHIVSDGWSIGIFTNELTALYQSECSGMPAVLPELTIQCGDYAIWQEEWLRSQQLQDQVSYWTKQLANLPLLEIPTDRPRGPAATHNGSIESILLPRELTDPIEALATQEKATTFMVMLAAFKIFLKQYTGLDDVYAGSVFAGRPRVELEALIGMFINPLVLRTNLGGNPTFRQLLSRVRETVLGAFANQEVPFERVVEAVQPRRDPSRHPIFQINFLLQRDFVRPFKSDGLTLTAIPSVSPGAIFDLNFFMVERADGWRCSCEFNTDLYQVETVRRMLTDLRSVLEKIAANPDERLSEFRLSAAHQESSAQPESNTAPQPLAPTNEQPEPGDDSYIAPRNETEARLTGIWERVLGVSDISVNADFFDLGGHSLLAGRLLSQVQKEFNVKLSLATLLQAPTIEGLAVRLHRQQMLESDALRLADGEWVYPEERVFPLRREGDGLPLIVIDCGPMYRALVRKLPNEQPVYGMGLPKLSELPRDFTVVDIAANLVQGLLASGLEGPYCLAGWSAAGVLAYEMANQLRAQGKEVALLVLFDTSNPAYTRSFEGWRMAPVRFWFFIEKLYYHRKRLLSMSPLRAWRFVRERTRKFNIDNPLPPSQSDTLSEEEKHEEYFRYNWQMQYKAATRYTPEPTDLNVVLLRSEVSQKGVFRDPHLGWSRVAIAGLHMFEMPGEHDHMFQEPDVQRLADSLKRCLKRARAEFPRSSKASAFPRLHEAV
jgi:non-ribosomal peptide synthetase component F/thioesterase domain-containing protein